MLIQKLKECHVCNQIKVLTEFHKNAGKDDGYRNDCKECRKLKRKKIINPERKKCSKCKTEYPNTNEYFFEYKRKTNKTRFRSQCKKCHQEQNSISKYKNLYNIDKNSLDEKIKNQEYKCAICKNKEKLFVDHNHVTKKFRGLICGTCNTGLGMFRDNIKNLENAIKYLRTDKDEFETARNSEE